jgi:hypothetical protein
MLALPFLFSSVFASGLHASREGLEPTMLEPKKLCFPAFFSLSGFTGKLKGKGRRRTKREAKTEEALLEPTMLEPKVGSKQSKKGSFYEIFKKVIAEYFLF